MATSPLPPSSAPEPVSHDKAQPCKPKLSEERNRDTTTLAPPKAGGDPGPDPGTDAHEAADLDALTELLYQELRSLAHRRLRGERAGHTLGTTALVNEAYLRLSSQHNLQQEDRSTFLAAAATTMRRVLIDYARTRLRAKRGGGAVQVPIDEAPPLLSDRACDEMLELDQALGRLQAARPRAALIFERRVFGGSALEEIATSLGVSVKTVQRDWSAARAWLRKEIGRELDS